MSTPAAIDPGSGRLRENGLNTADRQWSMWTHLSPIAGVVFAPLFITPLILWLVGKDRSHFVDDHGREVVNFGISYLVMAILLCWTIVVPIILFIVGLVNIIRGAVAASNGEYFRYPLTFRFV